MAKPDAKAQPAATEAEVLQAHAAYERVHWGRRGKGGLRHLVVADPSRPLTELGSLVSVVYRTRKGGDRELTDYEHAFSTRRLPTLAFEPETQLLVICGGIYRVNARGILD